MFKMKRHTALITGAGHRVGKAIALAFARAGHDIILHYNSSAKAAEATAAEITAIGVKCHLLQHDLSDTASLHGFMDKAFAIAPQLDVLVNSAAIFEQKPFMQMSLDEFSRHHNINLAAPVFLTQAFAAKCKDGAVVNIIDTFIRRDKTSFFAYLLAKKSLADFTRMAAIAIAPAITVNAVLPGSMLPAPGFGDEYLERKKAELPQQKLPTPREVADATLILATSNLTGQFIYIDGGEQLT